MNKKPPIVSSLSIAFKKATGLVEDAAEAKKEHRTNLKTLVTKYFDDIKTGKAEGIRNAKEFVEVIKADLLLLGEATERRDATSEEQRMLKVQSIIDVNDPNLDTLIKSMMEALNSANDDDDNINVMNPEHSVESVALDAIEEEEKTEEE